MKLPISMPTLQAICTSLQYSIRNVKDYPHHASGEQKLAILLPLENALIEIRTLIKSHE